MKTFDQLTDNEKAKAIDAAVSRLLEGICEGVLRFSDEKNGDDLQARIDAAFERAEKLRTPWFAADYIMDAAGDEIREMAQCDAEDSVYSEPGERIVRGVAS
jgi:hypothetical protein